MTSLDIIALSPSHGVEIRGVDLTKKLSLETAETLRRLVREHRLLVFRDQALTAEDQIRAMSVFGNVIAETPDRSMSSLVTNVDPNGYVAISDKLVFHADYQFRLLGPLRLLSLYATEMDQGEPTNYANMVRGLSRLPHALRARLAGLRVVQINDLSYSTTASVRNRLSELLDRPVAQVPRSVQPAVARHPETNEEFLNISQLHTSHFEGWSDDESERLFAEMEPYVYAPDNIYRHVWGLRDFVIWDNVALQHGREELKATSRRTMRRVAVHPIDVPTLMHDVRPDPVSCPGLQWWSDEART